MDKNDRATFTFVGTEISWIGYRDEWSGVARVYLDNALKATVDTFASPAKAQAVLYSVAGLSSASHTLIIEATGKRNRKSGGSWVWVDALDVRTGSTPNSGPEPEPSPSVTRYEQNNAAIAYGGTWSTNNLSSHSEGSAFLTMDSGNRATITFVGTGISWLGYGDEWSGVARVYLDTSLAATVDTFASPAKAQTVLYSVAGLPSGTHTLVIEATGTRNLQSGGSWVWIDALDVIAGPNP
jgi:alpha-amylase